MNNHTPDTRTLEWPNCYNVRDLGGLPTEYGHFTKSGVVVRSDVLGRLTEEGLQAMLAYGINTVIDLRGAHEVEEYPYDFDGHSPENLGLTYMNRPLEHYYPHVGEKIRNADTKGEIYCIVLDHYPDLTAEVMRSILQIQPKGVVIHCHAGKDRTGVIAALLLRLAGVPDELIAADYVESQNRLWPLYEKLVAEAGGEENVGFWMKPTTTADMMMMVLNHLDSKYGGVGEYLASAGLSSGEIELLRKLLIP